MTLTMTSGVRCPGRTLRTTFTDIRVLDGTGQGSQPLSNRRLKIIGTRAIANDITVYIPVPGKRSDTDIALAAANALKWNASLGQCDIAAVVSDGCISLSGHVAYGYQVNVAEAAVRYLLGVTAIHNNLTIKPSVKMVDVKQKIEDAFQRQARLDAKDIDVGLNDNKVTLKGFVSSWREKDDAARAAWAAPGVCKVENQLLVSY